MKDIFANTIQLIRIKHWVKNGFVFLPAFFAGQFTALTSLNLLLVFISFCLAASSIYVINDWVDVEKDRQHPEKCKRPIASGFFSKGQALLILGILLLLFIFIVSQLSEAKWYVLGYFIMNLAYSFKLKQISIIDVSCISTGFVLRVLAGGAETGIPISHWMIIMVFLLTISMAFAKRRDDLVLELDKAKVRKSLEGYNLQFLDMVTSITFAITLISYIMYSISPEVVERMGSDKVYFSFLFVFLGVIRYLQLTLVLQKSGSPVEILWNDIFIQIVIVLWLSTFGVLIYGSKLPTFI